MVLNLESIARKNEQTITTMDRQRVETRMKTKIGTSLMLMLGITVSVGCVNGWVYQVYIGMNERTDEQVSKMDRCTGLGDEDQGSNVGIEGCDGPSTWYLDSC